jgi:O-antigen/teichoic acid export membrane protein
VSDAPALLHAELGILAPESGGSDPLAGGAILEPPSASRARRAWLLQWTGRVAEFGAVQVGVQILAGLAGILVVRTLAKEQYALYAITNQMQTACNLLADLGVGIGVRSIGGRVWQDRQRFGSLVTTALDLRRWFALFSLGGCLPVAAWMLVANGASWSAAAVLCGVLIASVLPLLKSSIHLVVPQLHGEYRRIQKLDFGNAALRLVMMAGLAASRMNAALAAGVGAAINWVQMLWLERWSRQHADPATPANADDRRELVRLSWRSFPNTLFFCFQGQVTLLILTLVGNPTGIADVTALGRLAVLLTAFSAAFTNVLAPRFARCQDAQRLPRLYAGLVSAATLAMLPVMLAGWLLPGPLLWVLGAKYEGLEPACALVVGASCLGQLVQTMHSLNTTKAWIGATTALWIPLTLTVQLAAVFTLDLTEFRDVLLFQLITISTPLPLMTVDAIRGLARERRR